MINTRTIYAIWDGTGFQDGQTFDDKLPLFKALNHANADDLVMVFDPRELRQGGTMVRTDGTEELVQEGFDAGVIERDAKIVRALLRVQPSAHEQAENRAEYRREFAA